MTICQGGQQGGRGISKAPRWGPVEREARRMLAADLFEQGVRQARVARLLGVSRQAVGQWHAVWREGGRESLVARPNRSRSYLTPLQEQGWCCQVAYGVGELGCAEVWVWRWWHLGQLAAGVPVTVFQTRKRSVISVR
ncbi:helix-turn-helix domain-containing protein [Streptomyces longwoodensis]|uniref:helix-turn-helix domain-containing protein n=1 Tax=Streptomyces longwoodensis TaxID=68231 RepID=UPI0033FD6447